jgi:hypothetical protein
LLDLLLLATGDGLQHDVIGAGVHQPLQRLVATICVTGDAQVRDGVGSRVEPDAELVA